MPTSTATATAPPLVVAMQSKVSEAMTSPVRFNATLLTKPARPPPSTKNDAQAMNVT